ncbi:MAG TPA: TonB-dependent receptor [Pyrinomonadaceae bacterium]|nr:TonB-dependent receptor [Pyrinomonadaceae bacterium]
MGQAERGRLWFCATAAAIILTLLPAGGPRATAQQAVSSATLSGRVEDENGAAVGGALVALTNTETNQSRDTKSDDEGRYRFAYLPVGTYQLAAQRPGFGALKLEFTLTVGQALDVPLRMSVAGVEERVDVTNDVPVVETTRTQLAETIRPREINELPLNGRNYLDLALLAPGVSRTNTGSVQRFAETSAVPGTGLSVAGQRNLNNGFVVDGLSANDDAADLAGTFFSQEVVREFQVVTSGGGAEFGRASGGVINVVTQSGTNDWRGRLYGFLRSQRLDARNPLAPRKDPLTQAQYGASIGGPLRRDRTFLFANFEQTRRNDSNVISIQPSDALLINNRLAQVGYAGSLVETGVIPGGYDTTNLFARIDHRPNESNLLTLRYSLYDISAVNSRTVGGLNAVSRGTGLDTRDQTLAGSVVTTLSHRTINEARFQFTRSRLAAPVNDDTGPAVNIAGVASFGTATFSPLARDIDLYELTNNLSTQRSAHSLKGGVDFLLNRVNVLFPGAFQGVYTFTSRANFLAGNYGSFQQAFGAAEQFQSNPNFGLFAQDEWRPRADLTINAGLRHDAQFLPDPIETDANNFAPRVGLAYAPGDHKTVLRAGLGIYFDRLPLRATSNALQRDGSKYLVVQLAPNDPGAPVFPGVLSILPAQLPTRPNVTRIDPAIENSYSVQLNVQVERELPGDASLSIGYLRLRGLHLILSRNVNVPTLTASEARARGVANLGRPDPDFGNVGRFESSGESWYDGMVVAFQKRPARWGGLRVSYTLSKASDTAGNFFFSSPQNNFDLRDEKGLSDNDQRHRLVISGTLEAERADGDAAPLRRALGGFQLGYIYTYASRLPFNVLTGTDRNADANFNDRPAGVGRNTGRGFDFASLDLRLSRHFALTERLRLEALVECFNALNRPNYQVPNNVFGPGATPAATFGRPTAASDSRQVQLGLRLSF